MTTNNSLKVTVYRVNAWGDRLPMYQTCTFKIAKADVARLAANYPAEQFGYDYTR